MTDRIKVYKAPGVPSSFDSYFFAEGPLKGEIAFSFKSGKYTKDEPGSSTFRPGAITDNPPGFYLDGFEVVESPDIPSNTAHITTSCGQEMTLELTDIDPGQEISGVTVRGINYVYIPTEDPLPYTLKGDCTDFGYTGNQPTDEAQVKEIIENYLGGKWKRTTNTDHTTKAALARWNSTWTTDPNDVVIVPWAFMVGGKPYNGYSCWVRTESTVDQVVTQGWVDLEQIKELAVKTRTAVCTSGITCARWPSSGESCPFDITDSDEPAECIFNQIRDLARTHLATK